MAVMPTPLPPSMEKAYHTKCIELKRRLREIEEANDAGAVRKMRLDRAITKMRITRAFLLDQVARSQAHGDGGESDKSDSPPPTPQERPPRIKRNSRRSEAEVPGGEVQHETIQSPVREAYTTPQTAAIPYAVPQLPVQLAPATHRASIGHVAPHPSILAAAQAHPQASPQAPVMPPQTPTTTIVQTPAAPLTGMQQMSYGRELPLIHSLPNGTSVMLIGPNEPKPAPWTIRDLGPQHQIHPGFESWLPQQQEAYLFDSEMPYLPYDVYGHAVRVELDKPSGRYYHIYPRDPAYSNPVVGNIRIDTPDRRRRVYPENALQLIQQEQEARQREAQEAQLRAERSRQRESQGHRRKESRELGHRPSTSESRDRIERAEPIPPLASTPARDRESEGPRRASGVDRIRAQLRADALADAAARDNGDDDLQEIPAPSHSHRTSLDGASDSRDHLHRRRGSDRAERSERRESGAEAGSPRSASASGPAAPAAGTGGFTPVNPSR